MNKDKINLSIVGRMNVGKSSLFNFLTGQNNRAIVDSKAGTTADNVISLMEIHNLGKVKLFDTAGIDEEGILGDKKRDKTKEAIGQSDLVLFMVRNDIEDLNEYEKKFLEYLKNNEKKYLLIKNNFSKNNKLKLNVDAELDLYSGNQETTVRNLIELIIKTAKSNGFLEKSINVFGKAKIKNSYLLLIIPLDEESPESRLLKPQNFVIERALRDYAIPVIYRPNLANFDEKDFISNIENLKNTKQGLSLIITDSQVIGLVSKYIPKDIYFTSFSVFMSNYMCNGKLKTMLEGVKKLDELNDGDKILIVEVCNHDRKCNDIATKQLPNVIKNYTKKDIKIEYSFGKNFLTEDELKLRDYKLLVICGGCMIDIQNYSARLKMIQNLAIAITNYGMVFSYTSQRENLERVVEIY